MLQQVSEARGGVGRAPGGQDHVNRQATLVIGAVDPPQTGLHQEPDCSQLAVKAGLVEGRQTLEDRMQRQAQSVLTDIVHFFNPFFNLQDLSSY